MTSRLSLIALDPHLALLRPPVLLRRDTARIADAHPALPCACSVSAGYGSREATRICPSPAEGETDRAAEEGWEPLGWTEDGRTWGELDADEGADLGRDSRPDAEAPACARCCGTGQEIDLYSGELDSCRDCGGTGLREPWRDPDYAEAHGLCSGCGISTHLSPEAGSCAVCDARIEAGAGEDDAPQASNGGGWDDDPDPGDGGLGLPSLQARGWAAEVEAEAGCPGCGRPSPHLYAGATCAGCLIGEAA